MSERPAVELKVAVDGNSANVLVDDLAVTGEAPKTPPTVGEKPTDFGGIIKPTEPSQATQSADTPKIRTEKPINTSVDADSPVETGGSNAPSSEQLSTNSGGGLGTGAKAGIAVGVVLVLVLAGLAVFMLMRRKRRRHADEKGEIGEGMIVHTDTHQKLEKLIPAHHQDSSSYSGGGHNGSTTPPLVGAPVPHQQQHSVHTPRSAAYDEDLANRPVSPVDDLLDHAPPPPGSSRGLGGASSSASGAIGGTGAGAGADDDDDREMAWILEEERKARERREAAQRLPTSQ